MGLALVKWAFACFGILISNWPAIVVLSSGKKIEFSIWIYLCTAVLNSSIIFWLIFHWLLDRVKESTSFEAQKRNKALLGLHSLIFGSLVSYSGIIVSSKLLSYYLYDIDIVVVESSYVSSLCIVVSLMLWPVIFWSFFTLQRAYSNTSTAKKVMLTIILLLSIIQLLVVYYFSMDISPSRQCRDLKIYWSVFFANLLWFALLMYAFTFSCFVDYEALTNSTDEHPKINKGMKISAAIYCLLYFPLNLAWLNYGIAYSMEGTIQDCNRNLAVVMINFTLYTCTLGIGFIILLVLLSWLLVLLYRAIAMKLCPSSYSEDQWYYFMPDNGIVNTEEVRAEIDLKGEEFRRENHSQSFLEEEVCTICLDLYKEKQIVIYWPKCKHLFHKDCVKYWTDKNSSCPNCKQPYSIAS